MFWGLIMEPGKRYAQSVEKSFHISKACLDLQASGNEPVSVYLDTENKKFLLCILQKAVTVQASLDLNFMIGDKIAFFTVGKGSVHLTGYLHDTEEDLDDTVLSEEESEEEIVEQTKQEKSKKRKELAQPSKANAKKLKLVAEEEDSEDDSDVALSDLEGEEEEDDMEDDDGQDDDDDDDDDESDEMEVQEAVEQLPQKKSKKEKKMAQSPVQEVKDKKAGGGATPKVQPQQVNGTPNSQQSGKKNKKKGGETPVAGGTPKTQQSPQAGQTPQRRTIEGGVSVEDLKVGNGGIAKPGKLVTVYYTGRLKQNNKQFDATNQGPGFKFRLGKGEVIKGWDIGLNGMKIGGKRRITIPPHMAYGAKGSPPVIPPNSALVFEVELRNVN